MRRGDRNAGGPLGRGGGLDILYAKPGPKEDWQDIAERDLAGELRERYWIKLAADAGTGPKTWVSAEVRLQYKIERWELGRTRNEPSDGFRYVFRAGTSGTEGRDEWLEVTEVFEGVDAKDIEAFMRIENGAEAGSDFDPEEFLNRLDLGIPRRAAQRRAADQVIERVERKLNKASYKKLLKTHGYGTLIVGLPLWFATYPLDPLRVENVIDDFVTRTQIGLKRCARRLRKNACPFWRIVVVWRASAQSLQEWSAKAKMNVYDDPVYRRISSLPCKIERMLPLLPEMLGATLHVAAARPEKKGEFVSPPSAVAEIERLMEDFKNHHEWTFPERAKSHTIRRVLEVLCFVRVHGLVGLERWVITRLSPRRWIVGLVMRRRALRLYRASQPRRPD